MLNRLYEAGYKVKPEIDEISTARLRFHPYTDLITDTTEFFNNLFFRPCKSIRIIKTDMQASLHLYDKRMNLRCWFHTGRTHFRFRIKMTKDAVGHLAAASIAGTKN